MPPHHALRPTRALVTGGAGFIGSHLVDALLARGWEVDIVDDLSTGRLDNLERALARGARLHRLDIRDGRRLHETVVAARPRVVFHLAAQVDVHRSVVDPAYDARTNFEGTWRLLAATRAAGVEHVVYSSTGGAVYGPTTTLPTPEDAPIQPISPYGQSKFAGEGAVQLVERLHGIGATVLRYANVYGPRQDPSGESGVVAILAAHKLRGTTPVVYGDGLQTRDFTFVSDVVAATVLAAERRVSGLFNVGTGVETSLVDLLELVDRLGPGARLPRRRHEPARAGEVLRSCLDVGRARAELGWRPATTLQDGLERTLRALAAAAAVAA